MAEALVRGVRLNYVIVGDKGPMIALTPGSRRAYGELAPLSQRLADAGYRVLLHDRRNCGASEVAFDGSGSEHEVWADDLDALGRQLGELPMFVGGSSSGARLALLMALRHPKSVRGLLLWRVTGGKHAVEKLARNYYGQFIDVARAGGMKAVAETEHFAELIAARPENRTLLLGTDVERFIAVMQTWRDHFLRSATLPIVGATEAELRGMRVPVVLIAGNDVVHTPVTARQMAAMVPGAELHDDVVGKRADDDLLHEWDKDEWQRVEPRIAEIFTAFLARQGTRSGE